MAARARLSSRSYEPLIRIHHQDNTTWSLNLDRGSADRPWFLLAISPPPSQPTPMMRPAGWLTGGVSRGCYRSKDVSCFNMRPSQSSDLHTALAVASLGGGRTAAGHGIYFSSLGKEASKS